MRFKAIWVQETAEGRFQRSIIERSVEDLPKGDILIRVHYSALNYKDALSATGNRGITRQFPHTPGIDAAGIVVSSGHKAWKEGDQVLVTGYDLGMNTHGGFGEFIRVPAEWIVALPEGLTLQQAMILGTAGFTAASAIYKLELLGQSPEMGAIVVTGATGGVGSMAVAILSKIGYQVIAITGKNNAGDYLHQLGAHQIEKRDYVNDESGKLLIKPKWAGGIDTVGGNTLATLLKGCMTEGAIVSTGLVGSPKLNTTVYPFILNGVSLIGVGSAETPMRIRKILWNKLSTDWNINEQLNGIAKEVSLEELNDTYIDAILNGQITGRILVKMNT